MRRRDLLLSVLVFPLLSTPVLAQAPERVWRVGLLTPIRPVVDAFRQFTLPELARLGFVEGRNLALEIRSAEGDYERLPALARELVEAKPDVIIAAASTTAIRAARAATSTIPIVMAFAGEDPIAAGWVQSYARPGGNVTGLVMLSPELEGKRLQILQEAFPLRRRIAVLFLPRARNSPNERSIQAAAERIGLEVLPFYAAGPEEYETAFAAIRSANAEAIAVMSNPVFMADAARLSRLALEIGLPMICEFREMIEKGCLIGYGPKFPDLRRRTAVFVARILQGAPAGELPLEEPTAFELMINLKTAKALGIEIPVSLLARADEVFE
jgi:putative ABC transport system substrate-binding protein